MVSGLLLLLAFGLCVECVDIDTDIEGNVLVVDAGRNLVVKYSAAGDSIGGVGGFGRGEREFDSPSALYAARGTEVLVADRNNHRIQRFDRRLEYVGTIRTRDEENERIRFGYPLDVALSRQGDVHILDGENRRVLVLDASGRFLRSIGEVGSGEGRLVDPQRLELDGEDNVYVLDRGVLRQYDPFGSWLRDIPAAGGPITSFSIQRDTMAVITSDSILTLYSLSPVPVVSRTDEIRGGAPGGIRLVGAGLYTLRNSGVSLLKFHSFAPDSSQSALPTSVDE